MRSSLRPGLAHTMTYQVPETRTVPHLLPESPDFGAMPPVLATGYLVGIVEWACLEGLRDHLDDDEATLGTHVDLSHQAPTLPGMTIRVDLTLTTVDGRRLTFDVAASDDSGTVSTGTHERTVIDTARFATRLDRLRAGIQP